MVKTNIPVLHSLSSERWQNFNKIPCLFKKNFFSKHLNKVILATILLILRIWVVLNTSVASMTSTVLITSLASMTSTASLASKNKNNSLHFTYWVISLASETSVASMNSTASTTSLASMTSSASFHQKDYWTLCFHQPWHQNDLLMWDGSSKTQYFIDFWHILFWRLWRTGMLLLTKSKGHT